MFMLYECICSCISQEDFPNNEKWTRCKYPKWEVVLCTPERVNIPCLMHDTHPCQLDVKTFSM